MEEISPKSRLATTLLALCFGTFGAHRFYLEKTATAVVMLVLGIIGWLTMWLLGWLTVWLWWGLSLIFLVPVVIWVLIDLIFAVSGIMKDKEGRPIKNWSG